MKDLIILLALMTLTLSQPCTWGQYPDSDQKCQQCHISCDSCQSAVGCSTCFPQMYLVTSGNMVICESCYKINEGCAVCSSATRCQKCSNGFYLNGDKVCQNCEKMFQNCLFCRPNENGQLACLTCKQGHNMVEGKCRENPQEIKRLEALRLTAQPPAPAAPVPTPALVQNTNRPQQASSANTQASNNQARQSTIPQSAPPPPPAQPATFAQVARCLPNYIELQGNCFMRIAMCDSYDSEDGSCLTCQNGFILNQNGFCIPQALAIFQRSANTNRAEPQEPSGGAIVIQTSQNQATVPKRCSPEEQAQGNCRESTPICLVFDPVAKKCMKCTDGFFLFNGLCVEIPRETSNGAQQQIPATQNQNQLSTASNSASRARCNQPCLTCLDDDASYCLTCKPGFTTIDELKGQCFVSSYADAHTPQPVTLKSSCRQPCLTCKDGNPSFCLSCVRGFTIVDELPGQCFNLGQ